MAAHRQTEDEAKKEGARLKEKRDELIDRRKRLWRDQEKVQEEASASRTDLDKAQRKLQHSMARAQWEAVAAVKRIAKEKKIGGLHGMLIELFEVDPKFFTAVEVAGGGSLFHVVVDTDETAATLLQELQNANAGRVTFMPLNRLRPGKDPEYPDSADAFPIVARLKYEKHLHPAFASVFRKCLIVRSLEVGSRFSRSHDLDAITLEGDVVNRKGAVTGGYHETGKSRLRAQMEAKKLGETCRVCDEQLAKLREQADNVDQDVTSVLGELKKAEAAQRQAASSAEHEALELPAASSKQAHRSVDAQKEKALAALRSAAGTDRARVEATQAELESPFTDELSADEVKQREALQAEVGALKKAHPAAEREAARAEQATAALETDLSENLQQRQGELKALLADLAKGPEEGAGARLQRAQAKLRTTEDSLGDAKRSRTSKKSEEQKKQSTHDDLKKKLVDERQRHAEAKKDLDKRMSRKQVLSTKHAEFQECIKKLGIPPKEAFDATHDGLTSKRLVEEINTCNKELQALGHVNKKALDQFANFNDQRDKLLERQKELDAAESSIKELIGNLDLKKDEAIQRTFKQVTRHFAETFKELVPGGSGKLLMKTASPSTSEGGDSSSGGYGYSGVVIRVRFVGSGDTQTMQQLSGGQKTMVALCLIFAIQRCDPAPFYIFDEIDANLDAAHRSSLAHMIERQVTEPEARSPPEPAEDGWTPTQFITTTFRPELVNAGNQFYGVTHRNKASSMKTIGMQEALRIIKEDQSRSRQHVSS